MTLAEARDKLDNTLSEFSKKLPANLIYQAHLIMPDIIGRSLTRNERARFDRLFPKRKFQFALRDIVRAINRSYASEEQLRTFLADPNHRYTLDTSDLLSIVEFVVAYRAKYDKIKKGWFPLDTKMAGHTKRRVSLPFWSHKAKTSDKAKRLPFEHNIFTSTIMNKAVHKAMTDYKRTKKMVNVRHDIVKARRKMGWDSLDAETQQLILDYILERKLPDGNSANQ
jgi:PHP family Zn ribbon phosphoesterase